MDNKELVLKVLKESGEPLKAGDISEKTGLDAKEVNKVLKSLKDEDKIDSPKRCFYAAK